MIYNKTKAAQNRLIELRRTIEGMVRDLAYAANVVSIDSVAFSNIIDLYKEACYALRLIVLLTDADKFIASTYQLSKKEE